MIALRLTDIKTFMNQLLRSEMFDHFLLEKAVIAKDATFTVDGRCNESFYSKDELQEQGLAGGAFLPYGKLRPACYQLMRGSHTPVFFQFILTLSPENLKKTLDRSESGLTERDVAGILINLSFQNGRLVLTTGISYAAFCADRTLDREWDAMVKKFFIRHAVSFEEE